jgi:hypothetical protein
VALPSAVLRLLRALSPAEAASAISVIFRLRHAPAGRGGQADGITAWSRLTSPDDFADARELAKSSSRAAAQALEQLGSMSAEAAADLAESLMLPQPQLSAAVLLDGGFPAGQALAGPARRAVRSMHAVHRDSLVIYPEGG